MIPVLESIAEMAALARGWSRSGERIGFVPTMGALHEGHLSLVRAARERATKVVVSIFVNPLQFGKNEDFSRYPRDLDQDRALLSTVGCDAIFAARADEMYPPNFVTNVVNSKLSVRFEGKERPGHFDGVLTVVAKLFHIVGPDSAFFGQKDAQQALLIRSMVRDLHFPLEVVVCPILREPDGLAMSSRNVYLKGEDRIAARVLSRALFAARTAFARGESKRATLLAAARAELNAEQRASVDYLDLVDPETLEDLTVCTPRGLLLLAARVGGTRLLDNLILDESDR